MEQVINTQPSNKIDPKKPRSLPILILAVILTAIIVGTGVYLWQQSTFKSEQERLQNQITTLTNQVQQITQEKEDPAKQLEENVDNIEPTIVAAEEATINKGWKKFNSNDKFVSSTKDWYSYGSTDKKYSFSIEYPGDWTLGGSVFGDSKGDKIAEFAPGIIALSPGQKCFDAPQQDSERSELLSQNNIIIGGRDGVLEVTKVFYEGGYPEWTGYWYPNSYCLTEGDKAFVMTFYETELNSGDKELFKKILSTLKFE